MQFRNLGKDGPEVSAIGIGAMSFSDFYGPTSEKDSHNILDAAIELGVNHIDTANVYGAGVSETVIGTYLAARGQAARDHFRIATKASITRDPDTGVRGFDNSPEHLTSELDKSLKRLGVDSVDLFYVHRREQSRSIEEVTDTLAGLMKTGKIRSFGFSEIAPSSLRRAVAIHPVAAVQSEYSLSTRSPELGLVDVCKELGTSLVAFSPVGRGLLTDNPPSIETVRSLPFMIGNPRFMEPNFGANIRATDRFRALAAEMQVPAAGLSIAWLLAKGSEVIPIPGTRSVSHLKELVAGASIELTEQDVASIEQVLPVGWAHGDRYSEAQWIGPERYC